MKDTITEEKYLKILKLQKRINSDLMSFFNINNDKGREHLATVLVSKVEAIIEKLCNEGHNFKLCDYSGDKNFENSEQTYSDGLKMSEGIMLHFHGFSVQATWEGTGKYSQEIQLKKK